VEGKNWGALWPGLDFFIFVDCSEAKKKKRMVIKTRRGGQATADRGKGGGETERGEEKDFYLRQS